MTWGQQRPPGLLQRLGQFLPAGTQKSSNSRSVLCHPTPWGHLGVTPRHSPPCIQLGWTTTPNPNPPYSNGLFPPWGHPWDTPGSPMHPIGLEKPTPTPTPTPTHPICRRHHAVTIPRRPFRVPPPPKLCTPRCLYNFPTSWQISAWAKPLGGYGAERVGAAGGGRGGGRPHEVTATTPCPQPCGSASCLRRTRP